MSGNPQLNPCLAGTKSEPTEDTNLPPNMKVNEEKKVECDLHSKDPDTTLSSTFDRIYEQCDCCPDWVYTTGVSPDEDDKEEKKKMEKDEDDNHAVPYSSSNQSTDDHTVQSQPSEDHPTRSQLTENQSMKNPIIKNQLIETHPTASKPVN
ncbi:hypothetical protein NpNSSI1_00005337 [Neofusicoccum parvum]|nr:hypothetical protein NpNSSI1_00005337 [Neofusicoccum parvum]